MSTAGPSGESSERGSPKRKVLVSKPLRSSPKATSSGGNGSERHGEAAAQFFKRSENTA